jgi:hypothetical protein
MSQMGACATVVVTGGDDGMDVKLVISDRMYCHCRCII